MSDAKKCAIGSVVEDADMSSESILDDILSEMGRQGAVAKTPRTSHPIVGRLVDDRDPEARGRLLVRWEVSGRNREQWLATLRGLTWERGDKVLLQPLRNGEPPVVTGVMATSTATEGVLERRGHIDETRTPTVALSEGASLKVIAKNGAPLVEISYTESGPTLKILSADTVVDLPGRLCLSADDIRLNAKRGKVEVTAEDDVVVEGKNIYLN